MAAVLLCLDRRQRMVLILGAVFRISSAEAAQVLGITPENFRKQLQRAKEDLLQFMENKCGLMNPDNSCKCHKKTKGFIKDGLIDPSSVRFHRKAVQTICAAVLFTDQPHAAPLEKGAVVRQILEDAEIREIYQLT